MDKEDTLPTALPTREVWLHDRPRPSRLRATLRFAAAALTLIASWSLFTCLMKHHVLPSPPHDGLLSHDIFPGSGLPSLCGPARHSLASKAFALSTGPDRDVTVIQKIKHHHGHDHRGRPPHVVGTIDVRTGPEAQITLDVTGTEEDIDFHAYFHEGSQELVIETPPATRWGAARACIEVKAAVYLPEGTELSRLSLRSVSLDVSLHGGLGLELSSADVGTVNGEVHVPDGSLAAARTVELASVSGDIKSEIPVAEVIRAQTTSGDISLVLLPVSEPTFSSCTLIASAVSGEIDIRAKGVPAQVPFSHKVTSVSGRLTLSLPFTDANLRSTSGDVTASLTPVFTAGETSLRTKTLSGDSDITVYEPVDGHMELDSQHEGTSGEIRARYPRAWEGEFAAESFSGGVSVEGRDVEVRKVRRGVKGRKGDGGSRMRAKSFSGNIEVVIGER